MLSEPSTKGVALTLESSILRAGGAVMATSCMTARRNGRATGIRDLGTKGIWRGRDPTCGLQRDPFIRERGLAEREMERATLYSGRLAAGMTLTTQLRVGKRVYFGIIMW